MSDWEDFKTKCPSCDNNIIIIIQHLLWNGDLNVVDMEIIENQIQQMFGQL